MQKIGRWLGVIGLFCILQLVTANRIGATPSVYPGPKGWLVLGNENYLNVSRYGFPYDFFWFDEGGTRVPRILGEPEKPPRPRQHAFIVDKFVLNVLIFAFFVWLIRVIVRRPTKAV